MQQVMNSMCCFIIQQKTARTSVYTMILTYLLTYPLCAMDALCAMDDTRGRATKEATYDGRWQQPMPLSNIAVPPQFFFGLSRLFSRST